MSDAKYVTSISSAESYPIGGAPPPAQIDSRRAQQLLERALVLSERGDVPAAVLACRQAITLNPNAPQSFSMLGLLLERAGDTQGAITAYETVLQIDPGSLLERESLGRLRAAAAQHRTARDLFTFDESELFDERADNEPAPASSNGASSPTTKNESRKNISAVAAAQAAIDAAITRDGNVSLSAPSTSQEAAAPASVVIHPAAESTAVLPTKAPAPTRAWTPSGGAAQTGLPGGRLGRVTPATDDDVQTASVWQRLVARPSHYFRGAPLAATTAVSLLFLFWAQQFAASRAIALVPVPASTPVADATLQPPSRIRDATADTRAAPTTSPVANANTNATAPTTTVSGGVPANPNAGAANSALPAGSATTPRVANVPAMTSRPANTTSSTPVAPTPSMPRPAPATSGATGSRNTGASTVAAPPQPAIRTDGAGGDTGSASVGPSSGAPFSPNGSADRDFTRVSPGGGRAAAPPRAEARAAREEREATGGNTDAIAAATRAIEAGGGDTALRYQRRAQLYLDGGDTIRAINDFQTAISAYNDMISRGDRVSLARSGIQASQRGIQIARTRAGR